MKALAYAAQMRELDRTAIEDRGIPSLDLMERAARAAAEEAMKLLSMEGGMARKRFAAAVFCGPGNNGGDGVAVARMLLEQGLVVHAYLVGDREKMTPDERAMEEKLKAAGGSLTAFDPADGQEKLFTDSCDLCVDALFGVGLCREVSGDFAEAIRWMNEAPCPVLACDIPSGVSADTGDILGTAVRADVTVTFSCVKPGLYLGEGGPLAGKILVADIGIPADLIEEQIGNARPALRLMEETAGLLPRRSRTAHKGNFGRAFILAGSEGYTGAPVLASKAAVRSGAGLVFLGVPQSIYPIAAVKCDEAMPYPLPPDYARILEKAESCDVALIGPGLGRSPRTDGIVRSLLRDLEIPVVLDADGINALAGHIDILDRRKAPTVLTPHDGEFQRLTGCKIPVLNRLNVTKDFAAAHNCIMILKGHNTVTAAPDGRAFLNATGNPGMAKGGSGDVLAGLLTGLLAQKLGDPAVTCALGVCLHGQAGDRCAEALGEYGMTPTDMLEQLPLVLKDSTAQSESEEGLCAEHWFAY